MARIRRVAPSNRCVRSVCRFRSGWQWSVIFQVSVLCWLCCPCGQIDAQTFSADMLPSTPWRSTRCRDKDFVPWHLIGWHRQLLVQKSGETASGRGRRLESARLFPCRLPPIVADSRPRWGGFVLPETETRKPDVDRRWG